MALNDMPGSNRMRSSSPAIHIQALDSLYTVEFESRTSANFGLLWRAGVRSDVGGGRDLRVLSYWYPLI